MKLKNIVLTLCTSMMFYNCASLNNFEISTEKPMYTIINYKYKTTDDFIALIDSTINIDSLFTYDKVKPEFDYRKGVDPNHKKVLDNIASVEKVPDHIQYLINIKGGKVIFFNGPITDLPEWNYYKGKVPLGSMSGKTWDVWPYARKGDGCYAAIEGNYIYHYSDCIIHEYGHLFDHYYNKTYLLKRDYNKRTKPEVLVELYKGKIHPFYTYPREMLAYAFENYYASDKSRSDLKKKYPEIHKFMRSLEIILYFEAKKKGFK